MMCDLEKKRIAVRSRRALGLCALLLLGCSGRMGPGGVGTGEVEGGEEALSDHQDPKRDWEQAPSSYEDPGSDREGGGDQGILIYPEQCSGSYYCDDDFTSLYLSEGRCMMSIAGFRAELLPSYAWTFADIVVGTWYVSPPGFTICNTDQECSPCVPL